MDTKSAIGGIARAVLSAGAGYLIGKGVIDQAMADQVIGSLVVLITIAWSIIAKVRATA